MNEAFWTIFWGVITFSVLIVIHEGGHFLSARMFGVKVHEFMLGLPGPALRYKGKKTTYGVTAIPLGGYVKIAGMDPGPEDPLLADALARLTLDGTTDGDRLAAAMGIDVEHADELLYTLADWGAATREHRRSTTFQAVYPEEAASDPAALLDTARADTYRALPMWKRIVVLSAGVVLNLLTAILVFTIVLSAYGSPEVSLKIAGVAPGGGAAMAGLVGGDRVTKIGATTLKTWDDLVATVAKHQPGDQVVVTVIRDGKTLTFPATLTKGPQGRAFLGVEAGQELVRLTPVKALGQSFVYVGMMFKAVGDFFRPSTFRTSLSQSSSVIGASVVVRQSVKMGPWIYAQIVAVLSLGLGVLNILPIPPLDGGKVALELAEGAAGRPLPRAVVIGFSVVGAALLFSLIGYLMYADTVRLITNS
jgi:regulator of sigma E protease